MTIKKLPIILSMLVTGCDKPEQPAPPPHPALVMVVAAHNSANSLALAGEVRPRYESRQGFRIEGKIIERKVDVGMAVKKGQVLARLDPADTDLNTSAAQADVLAAEASRSLAAAELTRYRQLSTKHFVSASALDIKEAELKTASARLAQVKAQADIATHQTQYANLTADRAGIITFIQAEPGQVVEIGTTIVQIADTKTIEVLVAVPESRMAEVNLNAIVAVKLWANPQKIYSGQVREISPSADSSTRAFNVRVAIHDADAAIKLGMTAGVRFNPQNDSQEAGFLIPNTALTEINGKKTVWVIDANNKTQPRDVVTGQFSETGVLVTNGLQVGEKIAIAGVHTLIKDQLVKPVIETKP